MNEYMKEYRIKKSIREKELASNKRYREKNKEKISAYQKEYRENNKEYYREYLKGYMQMRRKKQREEKLIEQRKNPTGGTFVKKHFTTLRRINS